VELSPNFALGIIPWLSSSRRLGDPNVAIAAVDRSRRLSPFDPLLFGMFAARANALARLGRFDEAAPLRQAGCRSTERTRPRPGDRGSLFDFGESA